MLYSWFRWLPSGKSFLYMFFQCFTTVMGNRIKSFFSCHSDVTKSKVVIGLDRTGFSYLNCKDNFSTKPCPISSYPFLPQEKLLASFGFTDILWRVNNSSGRQARFLVFLNTATWVQQCSGWTVMVVYDYNQKCNGKQLFI